MNTTSKQIVIFPYLNTNKIIKLWDFEIHPYEKYNFKEELDWSDIQILTAFIKSFRVSFFKKNQLPEAQPWIGVLKYKGSIIRTEANTSGMEDRIKLLFFLLKLHISFDFFNTHLNFISTKAFDVFWVNVQKDGFICKFWHLSTSDKLYTTTPGNIVWMKGVEIYPLGTSCMKIDILFRIATNGNQLLWVNSIVTDLSPIFGKLLEKPAFYWKLQTISEIYFWLEHQGDAYFYIAIVPTLLEVLFSIEKDDKKRQAVICWEELDKVLIKNNDYITTTSSEIQKERWLIARSISNMYDIRNNFLHAWKKKSEKLEVEYRWQSLSIYQVFQLIMKYAILKQMAENLMFESPQVFNMDAHLEDLFQKAVSDNNLYNNI